MNEIFVDTGALIAIVSKNDAYHAESINMFQKLADEKEKLFTSEYVIDEFITWMCCSKKMDMDKVVNFIRGVMIGDLEIVDVDQEIFGNALRILKHFKDQFFSFTDCTSFVIMKMKKIKKVLSTDKHFATAGFNNLIKL